MGTGFCNVLSNLKYVYLITMHEVLVVKSLKQLCNGN